MPAWVSPDCSTRRSARRLACRCTVPRPPNRLVPPMTTAVIVSRLAVGYAFGRRRRAAAERLPGGQAVQHAGQHVHRQQHPADVDAGALGRQVVVADGVDVPAPGGPGEREVQGRTLISTTHHADGDLELTEQERRPWTGTSAGRPRPARLLRVQARRPPAATVSRPSVTMNGGSPSRDTIRPEMQPEQPRRRRSRAAAPGSAGHPLSMATLAMTSVPSTMMAPLARSMPAVRMMIVWPSARVPTTTDCCRISEMLSTLRKFSVKIGERDDRQDQRGERSEDGVAEDAVGDRGGAGAGGVRRPGALGRGAHLRANCRCIGSTLGASVEREPADGVAGMRRQPQQFCRPQVVSLASSPLPASGLSVTSWTPVSM